MPQQLVINLNNIIPPWDYIKIITALLGKYKINSEIKTFIGDFRVPLNFPYQCSYEQMGCSSILRDFDRSGGGLFSIEKRIIPGIPWLGWIYNIEQTLWVSSTCRWGIIECCEEFTLHIKAGTEENETLARWQEMAMVKKERR